MKLDNLTDETLSERLNEILNEQERRARLARVPADIAKMSKQYVADGGDKAAIMDALKESDETDEPVSPTPELD